MNKTEIYYFSGTGNSLHVAKELQKLLPNTELIPIMKMLKEDHFEIDADVAGFIFPVHAFTFPIPFREFFKKARLKSSTYTFAIATKGGSPSIALSEIDSVIGKNGKRLDSFFYINMPANVIFIHGLDTPEEIEEKENKLKIKLDVIKTAIINRIESREKDDEINFFNGKILFPVIGNFIFPKFAERVFKWSSDSKCNGCGSCEKICLAKKIIMKNGRPEWLKKPECTFCFACINYCPVQAIQIKGTKTNTLGRYHHENISATHIAMQKLGGEKNLKRSPTSADPTNIA